MANAYINFNQVLSPSDLFYINTKKQLQADIIISPDTFIFSGASILQPSPLFPTPTMDSFEFYVNGQNIPSSLASFNNYDGGVSITFNTTSVGFNLEIDDKIIAIGKFA